MRAVKIKMLNSRRLEILLNELEEELQTAGKLLSQLKMAGLLEEQREMLLGELSAAVSHIHEHTEGLDELIIEEIGKAAGKPPER
ncbi:MAG: hypothetical protein AB1556_02175 [Bacillota bacterium]